MRLNPSDRYLAILQDTLQNVIEPELSTGAAKAAAAMMGTVLAELLKREHGTVDILRTEVTAGESLATEIAAALQRETPVPSVSTNDSFTAWAARHASVTEQLAQLADVLRASALPRERIAALLQRCAEWELSFYRREAELAAPELPHIAPRGEPLARESLQAFLNRDRGDAVELTHFEPLTGGFGKQTYLCSYRGESDGQTHDIVVRKTDPTPIMTHAVCDLETEYALLRTLATIDYPAPKPIAFAQQWQNVDGTFYTMPRIAGAPPGGFLTGMHGAASEAMLLELAELLARLHQVPFELFADYIRDYDDPRILTATVAESYRYTLEGWARYIETQRYLASPFLAWLMDWLMNHIPADTRRPILIHGDFNIHNVLALNGRITGVLDWECAGFGAPEQDLAYIRPHVSRYIDWQRFVDHYLAHGGHPVREEAMGFGMVYAILRTYLASNRATQNLQSGANRDIRYTMTELGFTRSFIELALSSAASA